MSIRCQFFASLSLALTLAPAVAAQPATDRPLRAEFLAAYDEVAQKARDLAAAIPEEKYSWRPAAGVRSVGEVVGHIAAGNYLLAGMAGAAKPADLPADLESIASKQELLAWLERAIADGRKAAEAATPEQLAQPVDFFGTRTTVRYVYLQVYGHMSEHLGQLIAYARSVGVKPPWSS